MIEPALKSYSIKIGSSFLVSLCLFWLASIFYNHHLYGGLVFIVSLWFVIGISVLIINHLYLTQTRQIGLNILSWILSLLVLGIGAIHVLNKGWGINCIPSFAYLASFIAIIMNFMQKK